MADGFVCNGLYLWSFVRGRWQWFPMCIVEVRFVTFPDFFVLLGLFGGKGLVMSRRFRRQQCLARVHAEAEAE